jgi:hypothetical protein
MARFFPPISESVDDWIDRQRGSGLTESELERHRASFMTGYFDALSIILNSTDGLPEGTTPNDWGQDVLLHAQEVRGSS